MPEEISKKMPRQTDEKHGFTSVASLLRYECAKLRYQAENFTDINGMSTGFRSLDKRTDGLHRGELIVIDARPLMGKSALMVNMAVRAAMAVDAYSVAMIPADLTVEQMLMRIMALEAKVNPERLRTGRLELHDWQQLKAMPIHWEILLL